MHTEPVRNILARDLTESDDYEIIRNFSKCLDECVNFGTHILSWDIDKHSSHDEARPIIMLFRNFLEQLDSVSILIKNSSIDQCNNLLRSAIESIFSIEYILQDNTHDRSMAFMTYQLIRKKRLYQKLLNGQPQSEQFYKKMEKDKILQGFRTYKIQDIKATIKRVNKLLKSEKYQKYYAVFLQYRKVKRRHAKWYQIFDGPYNIEQLADSIDLGGIYEGFYRPLSASIHNINVIDGKLIYSTETNSVNIVQLRYPKDAQSVTSKGLTMAQLCFYIMIKNRHPHKQDTFQNWRKINENHFSQISLSKDLIQVIHK